MAAQILTSFTPQLVVALCNIVQEVSDHCLSKQLIGNEVRKRILESTTTSEEQVRTLLTAVKDAVATDQTLFEVMMEILRNVAFSAQEGRRVPPFIQEMEEQSESACCNLSRAVSVNGETLSQLWNYLLVLNLGS